MKKKMELVEYNFEGDLFVDIGGNVGMWSKELYNEYSKIIFIEPSQKAIDDAKNNIDDSKKKITFLKKICSNILNEKKSIFATTSDTGNFSLFAKDLYGDENVKMTEEDIDTITIDSLLRRNVVKESQKILIN